MERFKEILYKAKELHTEGLIRFNVYNEGLNISFADKVLEIIGDSNKVFLEDIFEVFAALVSGRGDKLIGARLKKGEAEKDIRGKITLVNDVFFTEDYQSEIKFLKQSTGSLLKMLNYRILFAPSEEELIKFIQITFEIRNNIDPGNSEKLVIEMNKNGLSELIDRLSDILEVLEKEVSLDATKIIC